jgi:hypothetical protein
MMTLPLKMLGIGGAVPVGAGYGGAMSGGAMSGGAGLADLIQLPMQLLSGILGGNIPSPETRFGSNPATWSPNPANYAKGHGVYGRGVSGGFSSGGASSGGFSSGGASSGGRKRVAHHRRGGAESGGSLKSFEANQQKKMMHRLLPHIGSGGALLQGFEGGFSSGGFSSGGRGPSAKSKAAAKHNPWIAHVKKVQAEKGISYREAMKIAKHSY